MSEASSSMVVLDRVDPVRIEVRTARAHGRRIGFVPTMGALHAGHLSLMRAARESCDFVAVSIFVNPTQFGPGEDLSRYPRPVEDDLRMCREAGVDLVFHPTPETVYLPGFGTFVEVEGLSDVLEGRTRPGHFRGVATVVLKLFNMVAPDVAFFGEKDFQQQALIRRMCRDLDVPVEVRVCPTIREADGLAMSSRNVYLSAEERRSALALSQALRHAQERFASGERDVVLVRDAMRKILDGTPGVETDYAVIADPETLGEISAPRPRMVALVAARVGPTRLIDNMPIELNDPPPLP